jgi:hypothetical protein
LDNTQRREALAWFTLAGATAFAMSELSAPLWAAARPLSFVQFPFRLHAVLDRRSHSALAWAHR